MEVAMKLIIREQVSKDGGNHFRKWLSSLGFSDRGANQARIFRLKRQSIRRPPFVGGGVWEARLMFGPMVIRIYFGKEGRF